ncbi:PREDICTED: GPI-anchored [Prunus dulcis]|uniref:PREDICTED: GPI-anchored n=1 Tax=Prunus dulcis TaxID=3755 RepID=A0A5E4F1M9_PRUDU|nr:PREDICTED: GPI-anchored [Prunus dulcis]
MVSLFWGKEIEGMKETVSLKLTIHIFMLFLCLHICCGSTLTYHKDPVLTIKQEDSMLPMISPTGTPQPFLPLLAPSPLAPFTNTTVPKLSGLCTLNFSVAESLMSVTSVDCWSVFAPLLANVICCPQLEATLTILIGQSSKETNVLALNGTVAKHCLSDIEQILVGQGANDSLAQICSVHSSNLTYASCPVIDVNEFEDTVDTSKLLAACEKIDPVKECCAQTCQNAILEAATRIASKASDLLSTDGAHDILPDGVSKVNDCKNIVLRWLASKLNPSHAKEVLRGLSNCKINKVCPLVFPNMKHVSMGCGNGISNQTACCTAMESYVSHLQKQSFITNLQALDCAASLGMKLRKSNITENVYSLCHISLKDFSLQVGNQGNKLGSFVLSNYIIQKELLSITRKVHCSRKKKLHHFNC